MKGHLLTKTEVAKKTMNFEFDLDGESLDFKAGQYFHILLPNGQKHHFTIVNSPNVKDKVSLTTRMRDSDFKKSLQELAVGDEVEIYKIKGEFVLPEKIDKPLVFIALGIGITPYISMSRYIQEEKLDYKIIIMYSDSDKGSMAYLSELKELATVNPSFKLLLTITKDPYWIGETRHIDSEFIMDYLDNIKGYAYYVSGAPSAVHSVTASLEDYGVPKDQIKSEDFTGY